jgi:hypothetical protein
LKIKRGVGGWGVVPNKDNSRKKKGIEKTANDQPRREAAKRDFS